MTDYLLRPRVKLLITEDSLRLVSWRPARIIDLSLVLLPLLRGWLSGQAANSALAPELGLCEATVTRLMNHLRHRGFVESATDEPEPCGAPSPSVSVVLVVRERPRQLMQCLDSLRALDWPHDKLEIVIVDDCSRDSTPTVARRFADELKHYADVPSVKIRLLKEHVGIAAARNIGIAAARGEVIAFTDSDCVVDRLWLHDLVPSLIGPIGAVGGRVRGLHRRKHSVIP